MCSRATSAAGLRFASSMTKRTAATEYLRARGITPRPRRWDGPIPSSIEEYAVRDQFVKAFSFAILDAVAVEAIRPFAPLVEIGAGSGYWSWELREAGIDVIPTDISPGLRGGKSYWTRVWLEIAPLDGVSAVTRFPDRVPLLVWPEMEPWCFETLQATTSKVVIYVGEGAEGCTGGAEFLGLLEERFTCERDVSIPQFFGIRDSLSIWRRRDEEA